MTDGTDRADAGAVGSTLDDAGPGAARATANSWRDGWGLRAVSAAMVVGGLVAGGAVAAAGAGPEIRGLGATPATDAESSPATSTATPADSFTSARPGDCLTWDDTTGTALAGLHVTDCGEPHLFEATKRVDVEQLPEWAGVFDGVARPTEAQILALRTQVCVPAANEYLKGRYNRAGRLVVSQMLPPSSEWDDGDRTLVCGLQLHDVRADAVIPYRGAAADLDQAVIREPGTCATIDENNQLVTADCVGDHLFEATGTVDLAADFPDHAPTVDEQNEHLADRCSTMATDYLGAPDALFGTELLPFWFTVDPALYPGTRGVNCWIAASTSDTEGLSVLSGSVRGDYTVDGAAPKTPADRARQAGQAGEAGTADQQGAAGQAGTTGAGQPGQAGN
ncbi:septum formation family protein [Corynebacterium sp.]|uniref:septum formation family protein n=1 Tax=Corynebacterium sp. TaxID=1720 RepID=UPI0026DC9AB4|nr:septum formation family protein [Corynebacterium sp.]MDO4610303.1 septum formation family protein [Corynebacterium sp.]